jgi:enamine deaminase RidA (YjgF/YER057c/UK114 family)
MPKTSRRFAAYWRSSVRILFTRTQDPATGKVVEGGIVAETERVFQNLSAVLKAAGKSFDDVVRAGVFLTSMSDFAAMNGIYNRLGPASRSTSSSRLEATHEG